MIESYKFGSITIDGKGYSSDVIVYPDRVDGSWWRKEGHSLCLEDIKDVLKLNPEVIIVGTGGYGMMDVPPSPRKAVEEKGIELIVEKTEDAWQTYNRLCGKKKVVACLHLTC